MYQKHVAESAVCLYVIEQSILVQVNNHHCNINFDTDEIILIHINILLTNKFT